jgi:hypothetical protein
LELSKKREQFEELALVLWHSYGMLVRTRSMSMTATLVSPAY